MPSSTTDSPHPYPLATDANPTPPTHQQPITQEPPLPVEGQPMEVAHAMAVRVRRPAPRHLARPRRLPDKVADPQKVLEAVAAAVQLKDEPECLGPGVADLFGEHARFLHEQRRAAVLASLQASRAGLLPAKRLAECRRRARRLHVDVSGDAHVIEQGITAARRGIRPSDDLPVRPSVMRRLEQLEARLDALVDPWPTAA